MSQSDKKFNLRNLLQTRRGKIIFCVAGTFLAVLLVLIQLAGEMTVLFPSQNALKDMERSLKKLEQQEVEFEQKTSAVNAVRMTAQQKFDEAWKPSVHGEPEVELRSQIENTAKKLELKLNNISTVRRTKFNNDLSILEVDFNLSSDLAALTKFWGALDELTPKLYWRRFELRNDVNNNVMFNGVLRCFCDERVNDETAKSTTKTNAEKPLALPEDKEQKE